VSGDGQSLLECPGIGDGEKTRYLLVFHFQARYIVTLEDGAVTPQGELKNGRPGRSETAYVRREPHGSPRCTYNATGLIIDEKHLKEDLSRN
jgi:hypothetical protein